VLRSAAFPPGTYGRKDNIAYITVCTGNPHLHDKRESLTWDFDDGRVVVYLNRQGFVVGKEFWTGVEIPDDTFWVRIKRWLGFE
jgi:hypothetical protein